MPLTVKQITFIREYALSGDQRDAAIRAGYPKERANDLGRRMLAQTEIRKAVAAVKRDTDVFAGLDGKSDKDSLLAVAHVCLTGAHTDRKWDSCRSIIELIAKLKGFMVEKKEVRVIRAIEDLSDDELRALAAGRQRTIEHEPEDVPDAEEAEDEVA